MLPFLAKPNGRYGCAIHAEAPRDGTVRVGRRANGDYLLGSELRAPVTLPANRAALGHHVSSVGCVGVEPQMRFISARWIITSVADLQSDRDGAIFLFPCQSGCAAESALPAEVPVSLAGSISGPGPTGIWAAAFVGVMIETLGKRPVRWATESFRGFVSHLIAVLSRSVVRAGIALPTRFRPAFSTIGAPSC